MLTELNLWLEVFLVLSGVAVGAVWLKSQLVHQRHEELVDLAETRGQRVEDLQARVAELEEWKNLMTGKFEALENLKVEAIVQGVVTAIAPFLTSGE